MSQRRSSRAECIFQRESTATIKAPPSSYQHASPPKRQNVVEFDCRGLEFTEFKADVSRGYCMDSQMFRHQLIVVQRASGLQRVWTRPRSSLVSTCRKASGLITTRRLGTKLASKISNGKSVELEEDSPTIG